MCPAFPGYLFNIVLALSLMSMFLALCHSCTAGHLPAGSDQFLPGPFLWILPALLLDVDPYATYLVLCQFPLHHVPHGPPHALLFSWICCNLF
jgi:hypothetical protein